MSFNAGSLVSDYRPLQGQKHRSSWGDIAFRALGSSFTVSISVNGGSDIAILNQL